MKRIIFIWLILTANAVFLMGQVKYEQTSPSDIIIEGEATDSFIISNHDMKQDLTLFTSIFASNASTAPYDKYDFKIEYQAPFKIILPGTSKYTYINFMTPSIKGILPWSGYDNMYILEKGDRINCKLSNGYYEFTGRGAEKLNCQSEIYKLQYRDNESGIKLLREKRFKEYFSITNKKMDSIFNEQIKVVDKYALDLGKKMTKIMIANCFGNRYYTLLRSNIIKATAGSMDTFNAFLDSEAYKDIDMTLNQKIDEEALVASPVYCNFLLEKIIVDNLVDKDKNILRPMVIDHVFNSITKEYDGLIREKLMTLFFFRFKTNKQVLNYLDTALKYLNDNEYKGIVLHIKKVNTKGSPFFPFELQDTKGNFVKLSDLNDKIVVLDFWYTGCSWCKVQYQGMRPVIEKYKDNPKVLFVSISIDKNKDSWLKSIASGDYTDPNGLNLYTNGLGAAHPVIGKNNISAYPAVFILKKGEIFSAKPPRLNPSLTEQSSIARNAFIKLIEEALTDINDKI